MGLPTSTGVVPFLLYPHSHPHSGTLDAGQKALQEQGPPCWGPWVRHQALDTGKHWAAGRAGTCSFFLQLPEGLVLGAARSPPSATFTLK